MMGEHNRPSTLALSARLTIYDLELVSLMQLSVPVS